MNVLRLLLLLPVLAGCQSTKYTEFKPVNAWLEPAGNGAVRHLVLVNASGQDLHNVTLSAYLWGRNFGANSMNVPYGTHGSYANWAAGEESRAHMLGMGVEVSLSEGVAKLEVVGHCDEGYFRQGWTATESGFLQPLEAKASGH
jgi:hypothetical protein